VKFDNSLALFQHLLSIDEDKMLENLPSFIQKNDKLYNEAISLIDAHFKNRENTEFKALIGEQAGTLVDDENIHNLIGEQVGAFQLTQKLGHGGMGAVYLGERNDGQLQQKVAIKFVYPSIAALTGDNFLNKEAQHLANLDNSNIAKIYTVDSTETGMPYMVMEYVDGVPIDQYCKENKLDVNARLKLFQKICSAVHNAHQNMVIHADIKPSNILVDKQGEPKLMDFGIARSFEQQSERQEHQEREDSINAASLGFSSPEQINNNKITTTSDIYSLGKVFDYCLKGLTVNFEILAVLAKMTAQDVNIRFQSITEVKIDFDNYINKFPVNSVQGSKFYAIKKFLHRHPKSSAGVSLLVVTVIISLITISFQYSQLLKEQRVSESALQYLTDIFEYSIPENNQNHEITVKELLDKGRERISTQQGPTINKRVELAIATAYFGIAEYDTAFQIIENILSSTETGEGASGSHGKAYYYLGQIYAKRGDFNQAIVHYKQAENDLFITPRKLLELKLAESEALIALSEQTQAEESIKQAFKLAAELNDKTALVRAYTQKASLSYEKDEFEEAINICQKLIEILDEQDIKLYKTYLIMSNAQLRSYKYDDAEKSITKALSISRHVFGENHDNVANAYYQLAMLHDHTKNKEQALKYFDIAIKIYQDILPNGSPELATVYYNKAFVLNDFGEYEKSLALLKKVIQLRTAIFGELHPSVADGYSLMANTYLLIDNIELNEKYNLIALEIREKTLPEGHSVLLSSYSNVANLYNRKKEFIKAEQYINKAIEFAKKSPNLRSDLAFILAIKGKILRSNLKLDESISTLKEAISIAIEVDGEQFSALSHFYHFLAMSYRDNKAVTLALQNQQKAVSHGLQYLGSEHPLTNKFRTLLAELYADNNQTQKAHSMVFMAYGFLKNKFGKEHRDTIKAKAVLDSLNNKAELSGR
jgi:serine/threonine-protein kinase